MTGTAHVYQQALHIHIVMLYVILNMHEKLACFFSLAKNVLLISLQLVSVKQVKEVFAQFKAIAL